MFGFDNKRRYQKCGWFERRWRDRHLLPVLPLAIKDWLICVWERPETHEDYEPFGFWYSIRRCLADMKRNYYYTLAELRQGLGDEEINDDED